MYNLNFIRLFNPHLKNINQYQLLNILKNINPEIKSKYNLILDINDFKNKYSEFDLQYYLIFNDDLLINLQSEVSVYLHYIKHGKNEERITNKNSFLKEYKYYDYDFFTNVNQKFIDNIFYKKQDIINKYTNFGIDINSKTFREIYISKIYSIEYEINLKEKNNNNEIILSLNDFNFKYPNIKIHFIAIFNEEYFPEFNKNTKITKELSYKIIKFYLDNKSKNINKVNLIFDEDDFYKKYPYFDIDIYKYFNKISDKEKNIYYLVDYHSNFSKGKILISCKEDFYEKYKTFDLLSFKKFNSDYEKKEELKCLYDYHINYDTETKLLGSKEDFYNKYPDFDITIFKKFNSEYENKSELECLYDYHNYRNDENTILISNLDEFYSKYPTFTKDKDENISGEEKILKCLQFLKEENEFREQIKEYNFDWEFYLDYYQDIKSGIEINEKEAFNHYLNYGKEEGRICSKNELKNNLVINLTDDDIKEQIKKYNFDWEFYLDYYQDIKNDIENTEKEAFIHYISYGKEEGRICNQETLDEDNNNINNIPENRINILIINYNEPNLLKNCIESILQQDYRNLRILVSYSNEKFLDYLNNYNDYRIEKFFVEIKDEKYSYDLAYNSLKNKVKNGFIMLFDNNNKFINKNSLKIINSYIKNENDLIIWNHIYSDKLIYINNLKNIKNKEIESCNYLFNYKFKDYINNEEKTQGYFYFFKKLLKKYNFDKKYINNNLLISGSLIINKLLAHLHCYNIEKFDEIYGEYIENIMKYFTVIVTYCEGNKFPKLNFILLKIENRGMDVGAKISAVNFLNKNNIDYSYILMLHSKSDLIYRNKWMNPLVNTKNIKVIHKLLSLNNNIGLIGSNCRKWSNDKRDKCNAKNMIYMLSDFNQTEIFLEEIEITYGNMYILNSKVSNVFFNYLKKFNNELYEPNNIQNRWIEVLPEKKHLLDKFKIPYDNTEKIKKYILEELIPNGITAKDIYPDGMIEHTIERFILYFTKNICKLDYLIIGDDILKDFGIKFDAIYFPQFHEIPENNKFWGKGFTEWTMLKPFKDKVLGEKFDMEIYKPHNDIGYYILDLNYLKTQIKMASDYGINSFMIYHYWFENSHKVMNKPLEYFLLNEINFNFYLCWANEPWCRKWSGGYDTTDTIMLDQKYEDINEMIEYLIPFFKKSNYQRNEKGEVIYLIYNLEHMTFNIFNKLKEIWDNRVKKEGIQISYIFYDNFPTNSKLIRENNLNRFIFEPMNSNFTIPSYKHTKEEFKKNIDEYYYKKELKEYFPYDFEILWNHYFNWGYKEGRLNYNNWNCTPINYLDIIEKYKHMKTEEIENNIIGLPLNWNNIVRRKNNTFLYINNFSADNLNELILTIICKILMKYINKNNNYDNFDNRILINAWNEWNEQAVLEPNNITGYLNLETIKKYVKK